MRIVGRYIKLDKHDDVKSFHVTKIGLGYSICVKFDDSIYKFIDTRKLKVSHMAFETDKNRCTIFIITKKRIMLFIKVSDSSNNKIVRVNLSLVESYELLGYERSSNWDSKVMIVAFSFMSGSVKTYCVWELSEQNKIFNVL